jgi:signal transduction histidine kinase
MKQSNLQTKLIGRLLFVLLGMGLLVGVSLHYYLNALIKTEVANKARLIFDNLLAVQTYVRETLRPMMYEILPPGAFVIEAMSNSYITRKVMSDLNMARDQFSYRRVALDPRNPKYAPTEMERALIVYFQQHPQDRTLSRFEQFGDEECYITARPVVFQKSCLDCHGRAEDAPAVMLARYGNERGFGRSEGEIGGLDMLVLPVEQEAVATRRVTITFVLIFTCGTLVILGFTHFFVDRFMLQNIGRLAELLRSRFPEEAGRTLRGLPRKADEIEGMVADMERFADHLHAAREKLADYATNLEAKVQARTTALRHEAEARLADVQLFLDMLALFGKGLDRKRLLDRALEVVVGRFGAASAAFHCFFSGNGYVWPSAAAAPVLQASQRSVLMEGHGSFHPGVAVVPVQAVTALRGALSLQWQEPRDLPPQERDVLSAVGRQLGIALENLEAMEDLLRRKAVLESIFEGIADPLFLLDAAGAVVHTNESAHHLLQTLNAPRGDGPRVLGLAQLSANAEAAGGRAVQHEALLPDGRSLTLRAYPLSGLGGVGKTIVYARDNTVEKTMLARLQQGEKALAVGQLAAGLAHEINNPLGVILCYAQLLWDDGKSPHAADLDIIIRHTLQAQKVLQDLMRFARPKSEAVGAIHLAETVGFIARVFQVQAEKQHVRILVDVAPDLPAILGDAAAMEQILTNTVVNALDALEGATAEQPGRITITAVPDTAAGQVILTIADNGPGIPEEDRPRVFDPFFSTKAVGRGTGLGLAVVYGLVRNLGGTIDVESRDGAVFTIRLREVTKEEYA